MPTLHPHIESLNSIKIYPFGGQDLNVNHSFRDLIVLYEFFDWEDKLKVYFFIDSELKEINPIYNSFKRIKEVECHNYGDAFEMLNILKQTSVQEIEEINFGKMNEEDFEQITNLLLNYKIHKLGYYISLESISNQMLENISKINLQKLHQHILNIWKLFWF